MGSGNLNDYYIFQSHGTYFKYVKLAGNNTVTTLSRNNQGDIIIDNNNILADISLIAFSPTVMQTITTN